jgi:cytidylate kinase
VAVTVVTLSAAYGAGGSALGPMLAERLGVPFLDRAIPTAVADRLAVPLEEALARDQAIDGLLERMLVRLAPSGQVFGGALAPEVLDDRPYLAATEAIIRERAADGAVILGRGAAIVLRDHPTALHVRLDGPRERRIEQAMRLQRVERKEAERLLKETDRAREAYVHQYYGADPTDPRHYHLVLDSTALALAACAELVALAAAARERATAAGGS